jgi:hypothetical protein
MKQVLFFVALLSLTNISCNNSQNKSAGIATTDTMSKSNAMSSPANESPIPMPDSATMAKNWQAYMTPSPVHKMIAGWSGKWKGDVTMWETPGAPPQKSKVETVYKMILGDRYQESHNTGTMMGMPFEGIGTLAYDNARKVFISTWIDNMGTGLMTMEGTWDEASKTINFTGNMVNPGTGSAKQERVRETYSVVDDHTHLMQMFAQGKDGKEFKTMEIKFTR